MRPLAGLSAVALGLVLAACIHLLPLRAEPPGELASQFGEHLERLAYWAPPRAPYSVALVAFPEERCALFLGVTVRGWSGRYHIEVCSNHPFQVILDTLIHEWAHLLRNRAGSRLSRSHDAYWGVAFAEAYQAAMTEVPHEDKAQTDPATEEEQATEGGGEEQAPPGDPL